MLGWSYRGLADDEPQVIHSMRYLLLPGHRTAYSSVTGFAGEVKAIQVATARNNLASAQKRRTLCGREVEGLSICYLGPCI